MDNDLLDKKRLLIIEDDIAISTLMSEHFQEHYSHVSCEANGRLGLETAKQHAWDVIILDIRLPELDGIEICKQLRAQQIKTPIIMLTSRSGELDRILGLEIGADDYVTKPFSLLELNARVKAIFRRQQLNTDHHTHITYGSLEVDCRKRIAKIQNTPISLTAKEFDLLTHFAKHPGTVLSRTELLDQVWGYAYQGYEHTVNSHINRLRNKLASALNGKQCIETVWGVGYKLSAC
ncbi:MAG: response regulator transcription factor [Pseudomonadota bacterium]|nr:response regulator transcription factor [Pseudomonadota bacterium]